jgi:hypothetical protein
LEIDSTDLWETLPEFCATSTYEEFVSAVLALYPGASEEHKWSMIDIDTLIGECLHVGILMVSDLAQYFCTYYTIMEFLKSKGHMSDLDQSCMFVQGFQLELWAMIKNCLTIKFPDHYPDDPYPLSNINEAAKFVLHGSTPCILLLQPTYGMQPPSHIQPTTSPTIKVRDLSSFLEKFSQTLIKALMPQQQPHRNLNSSSNQNSNTHLHSHTHIHDNVTPPNHCYFCSELGHYGYNCPICAQYLTDGKICRNQEGKVVLTSGSYILRSTPGITLHNRVDEYHKWNPNQTVTGVLSSNMNPQSNQLMYSISPAPSSIPAPVILQNANMQILDNISEQAKTKQYIKSLEHELFNLHHKQTFDGVEILC